jgi:hypothetical protein
MKKRKSSEFKTFESLIPGKRLSAINDIDQNDDDGDYKKNMNKATHGVGGYEPQKPQND